MCRALLCAAESVFEPTFAITSPALIYPNRVQFHRVRICTIHKADGDTAASVIFDADGYCIKVFIPSYHTIAEITEKLKTEQK